jgi:protein-histidine pros-kinase
MRVPLLVKVNLVVLPVMAAMLGFALVSVKRTADRTALEETHHTARLIVAAAQATFDYTVEQIKPALEAKYEFLAQSISSYAATETIGRLGPDFKDFHYHVAALNPTNPRDLADPWEAQVIRTLALEPKRSEVVELRDIDGNRFEYIATPIRINNEGCLACHSTPEAAPKLMTDSYGTANGFGWHLNEVIAAQVVSVPVAVAQRRADAIYGRVSALLIGEFALMLLLINGAAYFIAKKPAPVLKT